MRSRAIASQALSLVAIILLSSLLVPLVSADPEPDAPHMNDPVAANAQVALSWTEPHDYTFPIEGYTIYRGTAPGQEAVYCTVTGHATTTFTDMNLTNGRTYYYYVVAVNYHGPSAPSNTVAATPYGPPGVPTAFTGVPGAGNVTLHWTAPYDNGGTPVTHYRIYRGTLPGAEVFLSVSEDTTFVDAGLAEGRAFYYTVAAVTDLAEGARSAEIRVLLADTPDPVTNLVATASNGSIALNWTAPSDVGGTPLTGYQVFRGTVADGETFLCNSNATNYNDTALVNGQVYFYKVSASNAAGPGPLSNEVSATPLSLPSTPLSPVGYKGDQQAIISWSAPTATGGTPVTGYRVYRGTTAGAEVFLTQITGTNLTDGGLTNGRTYYYRVSAVNALGEGSKTASVSVVPMTVPGAPGSASARGDLSKVTLTWAAPASTGGSNVTGYNVYRGDGAGGLSLLTSVGSVLTYTDAGLPAGATYYYHVTAKNGAGEGAPSLEVHATTFAAPSGPRSVTPAPGNATVSLRWTAPSDNGRTPITQYVVYRGTSPGELAKLGAVQGLNYIDQELTNGQTYYYRVAAVNAVGEGAPSEEVSSVPALPPTEPTWLVATPSSQQIALNWTAPASNGGSPVLGYNIYRSTPPGNVKSLLTTVTGTSFIDSGLVNGERYYYQISAYNAAGEGALSAEASAAPARAPGAPTGLQGVGGLRQVTLTWSAPTDAGGSAVTGYNVYRGTVAGGEAPAPVATGVRSPFTDTGLQDSTSYYYQVCAVNSVGTGQRSQEAVATTLFVPTPPSGLETAGSDRAVGLTWAASASSDGSPLTYRLYRSTASSQEAYLATVSSTSYTDTGLLNGITYRYRVTAVNATGEGAPSDQASAIPCTLPSAPLNLTADGGEGMVIVQWNPPYDGGGSPVTGYRLYWRTSPTEEFEVVEVSGGAHFHSGLTNGLRYTYKVAAVNAAGEGPASDEASATPQARPAPPYGLHAEGGDGRVDLTWTAPAEASLSGIQGYRIYRGNSSLDMRIYDVSDSTTYTDTRVTNGQTYYYRVAAVNASGESRMSNEASATPSPPPQDLMSVLGRYSLELMVIVIVVLLVVGAVFIMVGSGVLSLGKDDEE